MYMQIGTLVGVVKKAEQYQASGASIQVITAPNQVNPQVCDSLTQVQGINQAGAIKSTKVNVTPSVLPQGSIPLSYVSSNFIKMLDLVEYRPDVLGIYVSTTVAKRVGRGAGESFMTVDNGEVFIRGIYNYPDDGRNGGLGYAILAPSTTENAGSEQGDYDACWANIWSENRKETGLLWQTIDGSSENSDAANKIDIQQLNGKYGAEFFGFKDYQQSAIKHIALWVLVITIIIGFIGVRLRRLELTSTLHAGIDKFSLLRMLLYESLAPLSMVLITALPAFLLLIYTITEDRMAFILVGIQIGAAGIVGYVFGTTLGGLMTQEKHLFKYFKNR
jgi:hypothetical protein